MRTCLSIVFAVGSLLGSTSGSEAADQASIMMLLKQGYEIKGTVFVPLADAKAEHPTLERGIIILTLQKGQSVAVCDFNWANWTQLLKSTIENDTLCDVRSQ